MTDRTVLMRLLLCAGACVAPAIIFAQSPAGAPSLESLYAEARDAQAHNDTEGAIRSYQEILRLNPGLAAAYNNLGSLYYDVGHYRKSIEVLQAGLRRDPKMASSRAVLASAYLAVGDNRHAIDQFVLAVKGNPDDKRSEDLLEQTLISEHEYAAAAERLRARVARSPQDQDAWYRLGKVYLEQSQDALSAVEKIDPDSPVAHDLQGELQENLGNLTAAQQQYELAVKAAPDKPGTHEHLGNVFWVQNLWPQAETEFKAELANDNTNCRAQWKLADSILNAGESSEDALHIVGPAIQRCPSLMPARVDRARAFVALGRPAEALDDLLLAEKADASEPTIHFLLAKVYHAQGKDAEAALERATFSRLVAKDKPLETKGAHANSGTSPE
jgi:tetratricopeptide (TPR) repeat protein